MKIDKMIRLVHCSDGRIKKEYLLDGPVTTDFPDTCRDFGEVREIAGLKKPFFPFLIPGVLNVRGFTGETSIEVWFFPEYLIAGEEFVRFLFLRPESGRPDPRPARAHRELLADTQDP